MKNNNENISNNIQTHIDRLGTFLVAQSEVALELKVVRHGYEYLSVLPGKKREAVLSLSVLAAKVISHHAAQDALATYEALYKIRELKNPVDLEIVTVRDAILAEFKRLYNFQKLFDYYSEAQNY